MRLFNGITTTAGTRSGGYTVEKSHTLDDFMEKLRECETK